MCHFSRALLAFRHAMTATGKKTGQIDHTEAPPPLAEGMITDFITDQPVKETEKEKVCQEVVRQLIGEYQIAPENMEADFPVKVEGKRKRVDIAIFESGKDHTLENLRRAIICRPMPNVGRKSVIKIRDYAQAGKDLDAWNWPASISPGPTWTPRARRIRKSSVRICVATGDNTSRPVAP